MWGESEAGRRTHWVGEQVDRSRDDADEDGEHEREDGVGLQLGGQRFGP